MTQRLVAFQGTAGLNYFIDASALRADLITRLVANGWGGSGVDNMQAQVFSNGQVAIGLALYIECGRNLIEIRDRIERVILSSPHIGSFTLALYNDAGGCNAGNAGGGGATGTYTVVAGDTLSRIASRFGMTLAQLLALNPQIINPNVISVGQVINISGTPHQTPPPVSVGVTPQGQLVVSTPGQQQQPQAGNWFDRTFFTGAGALSGVGIGVLVVIGAVVLTQRR